MGASGPRKGWPSEKLRERLEYHRDKQRRGDRTLSRDGELILSLDALVRLYSQAWTASEREVDSLRGFAPEGFSSSDYGTHFFSGDELLTDLREAIEDNDGIERVKAAWRRKQERDDETQ